jgi:hypothetical protein
MNSFDPLSKSSADGKSFLTAQCFDFLNENISIFFYCTILGVLSDSIQKKNSASNEIISF